MLWSLRKNRDQVDCELHFRGESWGWECQCLLDDGLAYGRRFILKAGALEEAEHHRQRLLGEGWAPRR